MLKIDICIVVIIIYNVYNILNFFIVSNFCK